MSEFYIMYKIRLDACKFAFIVRKIDLKSTSHGKCLKVMTLKVIWLKLHNFMQGREKPEVKLSKATTKKTIKVGKRFSGG